MVYEIPTKNIQGEITPTGSQWISSVDVFKVATCDEEHLKKTIVADSYSL